MIYGQFMNIRGQIMNGIFSLFLVQNDEIPAGMPILQQISRSAH